MTLLKWLIAVAAVFGGFVALMYVAQRALMYHPEVLRTPPATAGLFDAAGVRSRHRRRRKGDRLVRAAAARPAAGAVFPWQRRFAAVIAPNRFRALTGDGYGLVALSYRGYGGSTGSPSEAGMIADAQAAYAFAAARVPAERIVVFGELLGTGVAVALAATQRIGRLILRGAVYLGGRHRRAGLLVSAGAALDEGSVPLGSADRPR